MKLLSIFLLIFLPIFALSQGNSRGIASLKLPSTPFAGATGESFVANPAALQSALINPANIASIESYGVIFSHSEWILDSYTDIFCIAVPFHIGTFAFSIGNTGVDDIQIHGNGPGPAEGTFNSQSTFFQLSYGVVLTETIEIGVAPKYLYEKIYVDDATGFGLDAGVMYKTPLDSLTLGCSLTNIGSLSALRNERIDLPSRFRLGCTYSMPFGEITLRTAAAISSELGLSVNHISIGGEAVYDNSIAVRFGYQTGYEVRGFSTGMGIRYSIVIIDYAYVPFSMQFGNSHIISIGLIF